MPVAQAVLAGPSYVADQALQKTRFCLRFAQPCFLRTHQPVVTELREALLAYTEMRKVFACLFTLIALGTASSHALAFSEHGPVRPVAHLALATIAVMSAITAFYLFRSPAAWEASMVCSSCHEPDSLSPCSLGQPRPSVMALLFGGIILTILIHYSQTRRFRCATCSAEASRRTFGSWLAIAWCITIVFLAVVGATS